MTLTRALFAEIEPVPIRAVLPHEAQHFTPWLRKNLRYLAETIGAPLTLVAAKAVGETRFADLLVRDGRNGRLIVVECQLQAADDGHLGQILCYLAGSDAKVAVWIATRFDAPRLSAVRWLNRNAAPGVGVYAVEVGSVRIKGSPPTLTFKLLERPQGLTMAATWTGGATATLGGFVKAFWSAHLKCYVDEDDLSWPIGERCRWRATKPDGVVIGQYIEPHRAFVFLRGRYGVPLATVEAALSPFAQELEQRLGVSLRGDRQALLAVKTFDIDVVNSSNWPRVSTWLRAQTEEYDAALRELTR